MSTHERLSRGIHSFKFTCALALLLAIYCAVVFPAQAATLSWSGGGSSGNWSDSGNWGFVGTPANGDTLVFPAAQPRLTNTNNIGGLMISQIRFAGASGGYDIWGNNFTLTNGLAATNATGLNTIENVITFATADNTVSVGAGASFTFKGNLAGSVGLTKTGAGTLQLAGFQNFYSGTTRVYAGTLELNDNAVNLSFGGDLIVGDGTGAGSPTVRLLQSAEIPDGAAVTVNLGGLFDLNGLGETIATLTLTGGTVNTGLGTLTCGNITVLASATTATISGNLNLGNTTRTYDMAFGGAVPALLINAVITSTGGGITKTGNGNLRLTGANTYTGLTTVGGGILTVTSATALGTGGVGTVLAGGDLELTGATVLNEPLTNNVLSSALFATGTSGWGSNIVLNANMLIPVTSGTCNLSGLVTGAGGIVKNGSGTLRLSGPGDNTYAGNTIVNTGTLELNAPNVIRFGTLTIGDGIGGPSADVVRYLSASCIYGGPGGNNVLIKSSGLLDLNGFDDDVGPIAMDGGSITTGVGRLALFPPLNTFRSDPTNGSSSISGILSLEKGSATFGITNDLVLNASIINGSVADILTKAGPNNLFFTASNSYAATTVIQQGYLQIQNAFALGSPTSGTIVSNNASLLLQGSFGVTNEALTLGGTPFNVDYGTLDTEGSSTNYWTGPIILNADTSITPYSSSGELHLSGAISGPGGFTQGAPDGTGSGILYLEGSAANTFAGDVTVNQTSKLYLNKSFFDGAIPHNLTINGVTRYLSGNQIQNVASAVVINAGGLWDMNGNIEAIGSLAGSGVMSNSGAIFHAGFNNTSTLFSGEIRGVGQLQKEGTGTMTLTGPNTYTGPTLVNSGILIVNGSQPQSRVTVSTIGTLGGTGTVGTILCNGTLSPGASPGILTSSNLTFSATGDYLVELTGTTPGSGHDQVNVRGTNNLANATLNVTTSFPPSKPSIGDQFVIINNDGAEAITGTFNGLPNNATFTVGDLGFRINYNGGDGNDVVLTVLNAPGASVTINNTDRGWYDSTGTHNAGNLNYAVGKTGFSNGFHNWFVFNVPQFAGTIVQAELLVNAYTNTSPNAQETYVLRNVSTPIATLVVGGSGLTNIYDDLADGPVYSVRDLQKVEAGQRAIIPLNLTFINDATAAAGGQIALGGSLTKPDTTSNLEQTCFGFSSLSSAPDVQLRLTFGTSTVVNATTRGWYDQTGSHSPANLNYVAGESGGSTFRNFFLFGLPSWSGNLAAAELSLNSYTNLSPTGFLNYQLHDVATPITTLTNTASGATSTFADLADGGDYGGRDIFVAEQGTRISVPLHNGFIGAATANQGGQIALGGSIANLDATPSNEHLFFFSNLNLPTDAQLWLGFVPATLPSSSFAAGSPTPLGGNSYQFVLSGTSGTTNEIQTSTDFVNWDVARTLYMTNANTTFNYTNSFPSRFFRARLVQ